MQYIIRIQAMWQPRPQYCNLGAGASYFIVFMASFHGECCGCTIFIQVKIVEHHDKVWQNSNR